MSTGRKRHYSRRLVVQALYGQQLTQNSYQELLEQYQGLDFFQKAEADYFEQALAFILEHLDQIKESLAPHVSEREMHEIHPIERSVLYLAHYELAERLDIPYRVVINEALELAKIFGGSESFRFINGVLDPLAKVLRPTEHRSP